MRAIGVIISRHLMLTKHISDFLSVIGGGHDAPLSTFNH
jgi:hypothetical protein